MRTFILTLFIVASLHAHSQSKVKNFELTNAIDGTKTSLDDFKTHPGIVVWFTCQACPFDGYYRDRLKRLVETYGRQIQFLLVNSCLGPEESIEKMKAMFPAWGLSIPYLEDKGQVAMNTLGARKSPEVFLLRPLVDGYQVWYSGAIDDSPQSQAAATNLYLKAAIDNLVAGKSPLLSQRSTGCTIKGK